jgi:hypothetical protein
MKTFKLTILLIMLVQNCYAIPPITNYIDFVHRDRNPRARESRLYYNKDQNNFRYYNGTEWVYISSSTVATGGVDSAVAGTGISVSGATGDVTFAVLDNYLLNSGDIGTGVYDFGGATSFEIVNGASPTVNATGEIAFDTNVITQGQAIIYGTSAVNYLCATTDTPGDNESPKYDAGTGTITWEADVSAGGGGDYASGVIAGLNVTYSADHTVIVTKGVYCDHTGTKQTVSETEVTVSVGASDWGYLYVEYDSSTTLLVSTTAPASNSEGIYENPDDSNQYFIGSYRTDSSGDSEVFYFREPGFICWTDAHSSYLLSGGVATSFTDVDCSSRAPENCQLIEIQMIVDEDANAGTKYMRVRPNGDSTTEGVIILYKDLSSKMIVTTSMPTDSTQKIEYNVTHATVTAYIIGTGYYRNRPTGSL